VSDWQTVIKVLGDDTRRRIVELLLSRNLCVGALAQILGYSEAAISQHLKILRETGLVNGTKHGYYMHYTVNRALLKKTGHALIEWASRKPLADAGCRFHKGDHRCPDRGGLS
jgi:ArsR family transcriptional regulator, arsenate/arsenite/antimonite-responsive transcriptional repressor